MNKICVSLLATAVLIGGGPAALSSDAVVLPPGVAADNWIVVSDRAGFVVTNGDSLIGSAQSVGVAKGYFMLRRGGIWLRIDTALNYAEANSVR